MSQVPLQFNTVLCTHCKGIVLLAPPGTFTHTTHLRCPHCGATKTIKLADSKGRAAAPLVIAPG